MLIKKAYSSLIACCLLFLSAYSQSDADYLRAGQEKMKQRDISGAISDFSQAIIINPKNEQALVNRALARMAQGKWDLAIPDCNTAIKLNPNQAVAYFVRGCAKANTGKSGCDDLYRSLNLGYSMAQKGINQYCNR